MAGVQGSFWILLKDSYKQVGRSQTTKALNIIQWSLHYIQKGLGNRWMVLSRKLSFILERLPWKSVVYCLEVEKSFDMKTGSQGIVIFHIREDEILN